MRRCAFVVVALLVACGGSGEEGASTAGAPIAPTAPAPVAEKVPDARALAISGRHAEAAALAEAEGLAELAAREKALSGAWEAVSDPVLRAELALREGVLPVAVAAAEAAGGADGAALLARAARAGASVTAPSDAAAAALLAWATAPSAAAAAPHQGASAALSGWRVDLLRAEVLAAWGDVAGALALAEGAAASAPLQANLLRAEVVMRSGQPTEAAPGWARTAAEEAVKEADAAALRRALSVMMALYGQQGQVDPGLLVAQELHEGVRAAHGAGGVGASGMALAEAALSAGRPIIAQEAAAAARGALSGEPAAEAAWLEGWAAYLLGDVAGVQAVEAAAAAGPRKQALAALSRMAAGLPPSAEHPLPTEGLRDRERALLLLEASALDADRALSQLSEAVQAADRTGDVSLRVLARLARESAERAQALPAAARTRAELAGLLGSVPPGLSDELAARALLDGASDASFQGSGPMLQAWSALASGQAPPAVAADASAGEESGIARWARGRAALAADPAAAEAAFAEALGGLPLHRQGTLALGTVLDGSQGVGEARDLAQLASLEGTAGLGAALACHEVRHRLRSLREDVALGHDPTVGLPPEHRRELRAAVVRARVEVLMFLLGGEPPLDMLAALAEAEKAAAAASPALQGRLPAPMVPLATLREQHTGVSFLSYIELNGRLQGLAITSEGGALRDLGSHAEVVALVQKHREVLRQAAAAQVRADPRLGDTLRQIMIDPFQETLLRYGRYQVVAPSELLLFSVLSLPESASGLRFLADIRTVAQVPSLKHLYRERPPVERYTPDFLGMGGHDERADLMAETLAEEAAAAAAATATAADASAVKDDGPSLAGGAEKVAQATAAPEGAAAAAGKKDRTPRDMALAGRHFGAGLRTLSLGEEATLGAYTAGAALARHVYLANLAPSADGGFVLADGEMSLSAIRAQPLVADLVFVSALADPRQQAHRARAFLEAGAQAVIVLGWEVPPASLERYVDGLYESLNRDRPAALALEDARQTLVREALLLDRDAPVADPAVWGAPIVYGTL